MFAASAALLVGSLATAATAATASATTTAASATTATRSAAATTAATPTVKVSPSRRLAGGDTVHVTGAGMTPDADVQVIQCNTYTGDFDQDCLPRTTTTAAADGSVSVDVKLLDPVYRNNEDASPIPVYCRSDTCRIFLAWTDQNGNPQVAQSTELNFKGAPATIHASRTTNLPRQEWLHVWGHAYGAQGHRVEVLEEACYYVIQGTGCYGQRPVVRAYVRSDGSYSVSYQVKRFLLDGTDCTDPDILGFCELSVIVFTKHKPDDSFGVSLYGQPFLPLTFRS
jgi:Neocarzinostatin family